jgi:hypothetical protein
MQVAALARYRGDDDVEVVEGLRAHIVEDAAARAEGPVDLDHVRATIAVVGTPEQICDSGLPPRLPPTRKHPQSWSRWAIAGGVFGCLIVCLLPFMGLAGVLASYFAVRTDAVEMEQERAKAMEAAAKAAAAQAAGNAEGQTYDESAIRESEVDWLLERIADPEPGYHPFAAMWALILKSEWADELERQDIVNRAFEGAQNSELPFHQRYQACYVVSAFEIPWAIPKLESLLLHDRDPKLRGVAACALGHFEASEADDALRRAKLRETSSEVMNWIDRALIGEFPRPESPKPAATTAHS